MFSNRVICLRIVLKSEAHTKPPLLHKTGQPVRTNVNAYDENLMVFYFKSYFTISEVADVELPFPFPLLTLLSLLRDGLATTCEQGGMIMKTVSLDGSGLADHERLMPDVERNLGD